MSGELGSPLATLIIVGSEYGIKQSSRARGPAAQAKSSRHESHGSDCHVRETSVFSGW
jgi:hypothetical protein